MAKVNMTGQTQAIVQLDPGKYIAEIVGWEFGFSSNGNEMLTVVIECCKNQAGTEAKGRIYDRLVFTSNAAWKIEQFVECFAASGAEIKALGVGPLTVRDVASEDDERYADILEFVFGFTSHKHSLSPRD